MKDPVDKDPILDYITKFLVVGFIGWLAVTVNDMSKDLEVIKTEFKSRTKQIEHKVADHESRLRLLESRK